MPGFYCPFRVLGNGTKCLSGVPNREYDIPVRPGDECQGWDHHYGYCRLVWGQVDKE